MSIENGTLKTSGVIQFRGGTADAMTAVNPLIARREIAVETDTGKIKVGNGLDYWNDLPYSGGGSSAPYLMFSKGSIAINLNSSNSDTFSFSSPSNEKVSVWSSDPKVATASVSGNTVTVNAVGVGNANIFVNIALDNSEYSVNGFVPVEVHKAFRYGYRIKKDESDPYDRVEYLYDAVGLTPAHMDFENGVFDYGDWGDKWFVTQNKPCMLKYDGSVDYYLDPNDYSKKEDGSDSDVSNTAYEGNAMAQFPLCWVKRYEEDGYEYEIISDVQFDQDYKAYAHTSADGTIKDFFYWSMFGGIFDSVRFRSISGYQFGGVKATVEDMIAEAVANGSRWYVHSFSQHELIRTLCVLMGKSTDTQAVFGMGNGYGWGKDGTSRNLLPTGTLNDKGQFFGYNTDNKKQVKVFHIEEFWGNRADATAGLIDYKGKIYVKMTPEGDGYRINDVNGYTDTGITWSEDTYYGCISAGNMSEFGFIPTTVSGSGTTYYCDYASCLSEKDDDVPRYLLTGGSADNSTPYCGAFTFCPYFNPSYYQNEIGSGLSFV